MHGVAITLSFNRGFSSHTRTHTHAQVNAKENDILKGLKETDGLKELETNRKAFITQTFSPLANLISDAPTYAMYYVGGMLTQSGGFNAVDIVTFQSALTSLVAEGTKFCTVLKDVCNLEDDNLDSCFVLMGILDQKAKIGIKGGYQPKPRPVSDISCNSCATF